MCPSAPGTGRGTWDLETRPSGESAVPPAVGAYLFMLAEVSMDAEVARYVLY